MPPTGPAGFPKAPVFRQRTIIFFDIPGGAIIFPPTAEVVQQEEGEPGRGTCFFQVDFLKVLGMMPFQAREFTSWTSANASFPDSVNRYMIL